MIYKEQQEQWYHEQINRIEALKKEHHDSKEVLTSMTETLEKEILLPINSVAFARATIYHTNETLILLGNNYFVERSVHQANDIIQRRIDVLEEGRRKLQLEHEASKDLGVTLQMEDGSIEIIEPFEEEKLPSKVVEKKEVKEPKPVGNSILKQETTIKKPEKVEKVEKVEKSKEEEVKQIEGTNFKVQIIESEGSKDSNDKGKKQVSFNEEVQTKELPKKVSKFKQEMIDRKR